MIKITINLATKRYPGKGVGTALPIVLILLSSILFLYLNGKVVDNAVAINRMETRLSDLSERRPQKESAQKEPPANMAALSDIVEQRRFSWIEALDNMEKAIPSGISLSSIQPSFKGGGAKLSGYARDFATLSRFIDNLEGLRVYKRVFLNSQSVREIEGKEAIVFNISIEGRER